MNSRNGIRLKLAFLVLCLVFVTGIAAQAIEEPDGFMPETGQTTQQTSTVTTTSPATTDTTSQSGAAPAAQQASTDGGDNFFDKLIQSISDLFTSFANIFKSFFGAFSGQTSSTSSQSTGGQTGGTSPGSPSGQSSSATSAPNSTAQSISDAAARYASRYTTSGSFPYAAGTENGNLGCANVVSKCLQEAGVRIGTILNVDGVKSALTALSSPNNWRITQPPPYQPGDVVIWKIPPGGRHKHIGIVTRNGNSMYAMNNSSSRRHPILSAIEYRAVECVVRKA